MDALSWTHVRPACPAEGRCIVRHAHQFYNNVVVAGIYKFPADLSPSQVAQIEIYLPALEKCLRTHPFLSIVVKKDTKGRNVYARASHIDLKQHFHTIDSASQPDLTQSANTTENDHLTRIVEHLHNDSAFTLFDTIETIPGWHITVVALNSKRGKQRAVILFSYSHSIGDGMSGMAFHRTFLRGLTQDLRTLQSPPTQDITIFKPSAAELRVLPHIPISPSYLLGPALGHYLPSVLSKYFGLKASASGLDEFTWTGTKCFLNSQTSIPPVTTALEISSIDDKTLSAVLMACRKHDAKLTSLINELIAYAMSKYLLSYCSDATPKTNFISCTATNIRKVANLPADVFGIFASAVYGKHSFDHKLASSSTEEVVVTKQMWDSVRTKTAALTEGVSTLQNQPIGLLWWVLNLDGWMTGQIGTDRDGSWQVSNLMAFDNNTVEKGRDDRDVKIEKMLFCQSAHAVGEPLSFDIVSVAGGELVICAEWQVGALGLDERDSGSIEEVERDFVKKILRHLEEHFAVVAARDEV